MVARAAIQHWHQKTYRLALIADAHHRAIHRRNQPDGNEVMSMTFETTLELTPTMLSILESGMKQAEFVLTRKQAASRPARLVEAGLIIPASKGHYSITEGGRAEYEKRASDNGINLDDPALERELNTEVKRLQGIAQERLGQIKKLNNTLDEMGRVADEQEARIKLFQESADPSIVEVIQVIRDWMAEDTTPYNTLLGYLGDLRSRATTIDSNDVNEWLKEMNVSLGDIDTLNEMKRADGFEGRLRDYVADLRSKIRDYQEVATGATLAVYRNIIDQIQAMLEEDGSQLILVDYVADLRVRLNVAESEETLAAARQMIDAILKMQQEDGSQMPLIDYVADLRAHLANKITLNDQYTTKIESLNRRIEELCAQVRENMESRVSTPKAYAAMQLAEQILDELGAMIPEVDEYRTARENAVKAISSLKARRSQSQQK